MQMVAKQRLKAGATSFLYKDSGPPTLIRLFVLTRAGLIELAVATTHPTRALPGLEAGAAAAVRALGR
jgi:hypothetical protein